jgi:hypothetical protein
MAISRFPSLLHTSRKLSHLKLRLKSFARLSPKQHRFISPLPCFVINSYPLLPKNFLALCASNYYDGCLFHRNIKGFMVQAGDPAGTGKGGQSIWGKPFPDEIRSTLKVHLCGPFSTLTGAPSQLASTGAYAHHSFPPTVQRPWRRRNGKFWT